MRAVDFIVWVYAVLELVEQGLEGMLFAKKGDVMWVEHNVEAGHGDGLWVGMQISLEECVKYRVRFVSKVLK